MKVTIPHTAVAVFNDGASCFVVDDHCYVLLNTSDVGAEWLPSAWLFSEALDVLRELPDNPDDATPLVLSLAPTEVVH